MGSGPSGDRGQSDQGFGAGSFREFCEWKRGAGADSRGNF